MCPKAELSAKPCGAPSTGTRRHVANQVPTWKNLSARYVTNLHYIGCWSSARVGDWNLRIETPENPKNPVEPLREGMTSSEESKGCCWDSHDSCGATNDFSSLVNGAWDHTSTGTTLRFRNEHLKVAKKELVKRLEANFAN